MESNKLKHDYTIDLFLYTFLCILVQIKVLYMSFDGFLLAFESRDLSQAGKRIVIVPCFSILKTSIFLI